MATETYLILGNVAVWLAVGGYAAFLHTRSAGLERRLTILERLRDDQDR